ncbi:MAG: hypothetical protein Kow0037_19380 [Calditrichia bacterium]
MGFFDHGWGFFDVSDPNNIEIIGDTLPGWRTYEIKTYDIYAYTANKAYWPNYSRSKRTDLRIFELSDFFPPDSVGFIKVGYDKIVTTVNITRVHDLHIEDGFLYLACEENLNYFTQTRYPNIFMFDLRDDPTQPDSHLIGSWTIPDSVPHLEDYDCLEPENRSSYPWVVEVYVKDNRIYMATSTAGIIVATFADSTDGQGKLHRYILEDETWHLVYRAIRRPEGGGWNKSRVTHTIKVTDDHKYLFVCDETLGDSLSHLQKAGGVLRMFDISNIENLPPITKQVKSDSLEPLLIYEAPENSTAGRIVTHDDSLIYPNHPPNSIHKVFLHDGFALLSYYTKGLRILDISDPLNWIEAGYYDTPAEPFINSSGNWEIWGGSWGVYPYFGLDKILVSDHDGLRTFRFGESGAISQNTTWSGRKYITGNVTVAQNVTLTIQPGSEIKFLDGKKITVNGTLVLNGSAEDTIRISSMNGQTGYGIKVRSIAEPGAQATINYCRLENLSVGIEAINADLSIQNSLLKGCTKGIYLQNSSADINNNSLIDCSVGIYVDGSSPQVFDNNIYGCSLNGIYVLSGSGTYLRNTIENCGEIDTPTSGGFYAVDGAEPVLEDESGYALNTIINNNRFGIRADELSTIFAGYDVAGGNNIYGNAQYDAEALGGSTIDALFNY